MAGPTGPADILIDARASRTAFRQTANLSRPALEIHGGSAWTALPQGSVGPCAVP